MNKIETETLPWLRSSYCEAGNCVEVVWRRSSRCDGGQCLEVAWARSSRCHEDGCVEVALPHGWRKSSASSDTANCVETAPCGCGDGRVLIRDSKLGDDSPVLTLSADEWEAFKRKALRLQPNATIGEPSPILDWVPIRTFDAVSVWQPGTDTRLLFTEAEWVAFVAGLGAGEFDGLTAEVAA